MTIDDDLAEIAAARARTAKYFAWYPDVTRISRDVNHLCDKLERHIAARRRLAAVVQAAQKTLKEIRTEPTHPSDVEAALVNAEVWLDEALAALQPGDLDDG